MNVTNKIRVLIVEDSLVFQKVLYDALQKDPLVEVIGSASNPFEATEQIVTLRPDVMTLDIEMPRMDGISFLKQLLPQYPLPVVVVSSITEKVFDALSSGAVDFVTKPSFHTAGDLNGFFSRLIKSIKLAATIKMNQPHLAKGYLTTSHKSSAILKQGNKVIGIGASTGGTDAIFEVIKSFSKEMPGTVIVQHMPPIFTKMYASRLNEQCEVQVKEAEDGDRIQRGRVLIAPGDYHIQVAKDEKGYYLKCIKAEKVNGHCPSVDVLFYSIAEQVGKDAIGVILTGMGSDGAKGILKMREKGAMTFGQDEKTSIVYGMPMEAYKIGGVIKQLPLGEIGPGILKYLISKNGI